MIVLTVVIRFPLDFENWRRIGRFVIGHNSEQTLIWTLFGDFIVTQKKWPRKPKNVKTCHDLVKPSPSHWGGLHSTVTPYSDVRDLSDVPWSNDISCLIEIEIYRNQKLSWIMNLKWNTCGTNLNGLGRTVNRHILFERKGFQRSKKLRQGHLTEFLDPTSSKYKSSLQLYLWINFIICLLILS